MLNIKPASIAMEIAELQNATQIAYSNVQKPKKAGKSTARRIEHAASRLQDAATVLENLLADLPAGRSQDDLHDALGQIMETQQLITAAFARLQRQAVAG